MQIHQAVEQIEKKVSVSSWLSEGERNVAVKVILAQILICLTIMRTSISLEKNDSASRSWDAVSRLSSDDVLYILLAAPLACCSSCQFLFGCQCLFRFESMPNAVKWRIWESNRFRN